MGNSQGHAAAQRGDVTALMDLLRSGYDVHTKGEVGTPHSPARRYHSLIDSLTRTKIITINLSHSIDPTLNRCRISIFAIGRVVWRT